jgi:hypothetical protein
MQKAYIAGLVLITGSGLLAQTKVDLANQSKNPDFSQTPSARPFPTGASLPATCDVGDLFFLTSAPVGATQCVAANTWAAIQGTPSSSSSSGTTTGAINVQKNSATQLTVAPNCAIATPCLFRIGSTVYSQMAPATATVTSGNGLAYIYIDANANIVVGVASLGSPGVTCSGCVVLSSITQYPFGTIPIGTWNATSGTWDPAGDNGVAPLSAPPALIGGSNITVAQTGSSVTVSYTGIDGASTSGSPVSGFNPADPTQFYLNHMSLSTGLAGGPDGWSYSGCGNGTGSGATGFTQESIVSGVWAQATGAGTECLFFFPATNYTYGTGSFDYWSGGMPATLWLSATYTTTDVNGAHYIGLSNSFYGVNDFIGCRQVGAGDWFAVIRAGGVDIATADTGYAHDNATHRLTVDNNSGTASVVRCSVDGANTATAAGTVPAEPYGWYFVEGTVPTGSLAANFAAFQYTIFLQNLPRI